MATLKTIRTIHLLIFIRGLAVVLSVEGYLEKDMADSKAKTDGFTVEERKAMRERAKELKMQNNKELAEKELLIKIAEMPENDREMATTIHSLVLSHSPNLEAKTWYGMPAWARDGKTVIFFQSADKFKVRFATLGFSEHANLDQGKMWPTSYALEAITPENEPEIIRLITKADS